MNQRLSADQRSTEAAPTPPSAYWPILAAGAGWLAAALALGAVPPLSLGSGLALALAALVCWRIRPGTAAGRLLAAVLLCSAAAATATGLRVHVSGSGPIPDLAAQQRWAELELRLTGEPVPRQAASRGSGPASTVLAMPATATAIALAGQWQPVSTPITVWVRAPAGWNQLVSSTRIRTAGRLTSAPIERGYAATLHPTGPPTVLAGPSLVQRTATALRAGLRTAVAGLEPDQRGLLPALVVGDASGLGQELAEDFRRAGLTHLLVVSGFNVAVVFATVLWAARWAGLARTAPLAAALAVAAFAVLAREQPSVLRATAMGLLAAVALLAGQRRLPVNTLALATLVLLLLDPWLARDLGFALSVLATGAILLLAPRWRTRLARRLPGPVADALAVTAAAQLVCSPLIVLLSAQVSLVSIPANLLAAPAVAPATLLGMAATLVAPVHAATAELLGWLAALPAWWIVTVARRAAAVPGATLDWPAGVGGAALLLGLSVLAVTVLPRLGRRWAALCGALALVGCCAPLPRLPGGWPPPGWRLVACDVGQGDATVLAAGPATAVVVDTGPDPVAVDGCLRRLGIRRVPLLLLTHFHADHVGGLAGVLRGRSVGEIQVSPLREPAGQAARVLTLAATARTPVTTAEAGEERGYGPLRWRVLWPTELLDAEGSAPNNASLVLRVQAGPLRVLLTGDVETAAQQRLLADRTSLSVDVLKVAHHGSAAQDPAFFWATRPKIALIGVGRANRYRHPAPSTLALLRRTGATVLRTDQDGDVAVTGPADRPTALGRGPPSTARQPAGRSRSRRAMLRAMSQTSQQQGNSTGITLVIGAEELLVNRAVARVIAQARADEPELEVRDVAPGALAPGAFSELTSPSLFSDRKAVVVREAQDLTVAVLPEVTAYLADPLPDVTLVLVHAGGAKGKVLLEAARKAGAAEISCPKMTKATERVAFVKGEFRDGGRRISEDGVRALLDSVGSELNQLASACGQLMADTEGTVTEETVGRYYTGRAEVTSFTVADRAVEGRTAEALEQLRWALSTGVAPVLITSALAQGVRSIGRLAGASRGMRPADLARELGMPPWKVDRVRQQLRGWTPEGVTRALCAVARADAAVKGAGDDPAYALELAVVTVAGCRVPG